MPNQEKDLVDPAVVDRDHIVFVGEYEAKDHSQACLDEKKHKVDRHKTEDREFLLHELAQQAKFEEECLPNEEEEPKDEAKVHHHLESHHCEGNKLLRAHVWRVGCTCLEQVTTVTNVIEEGHGVADDLNYDENEEGDDL